MLKTRQSQDLELSARTVGPLAPKRWGLRRGEGRLGGTWGYFLFLDLDNDYLGVPCEDSLGSKLTIYVLATLPFLKVG